jgi:ABC-type sugar transport system substrate-binding protein
LQEAGILISPTDSSTAPSVLSLAEKFNIPVVIADIGDTKEVALDQMQRYTADETFNYVQNMLTAHSDLRGIPDLAPCGRFEATHRQDSVLLAAFDGVPKFIDLMRQGKIAASGMLQPFLMGVSAEHLHEGTSPWVRSEASKLRFLRFSL